MRGNGPEAHIPGLLYLVVFQFVLILFFSPLVTQYEATHQKKNTTIVDEQKETAQDIFSKSNDDELIASYKDELEHDYAYVTLCSTDRILNLTLVWAESLIQTGTPYPIIALVSKEMSKEGIQMLTDIGVEPRVIDIIPQPKQPKGRGGRTPRDRSKVFSKLWIWSLVEYSKVVFMDSDIVVLKNIDDIFDTPLEIGEIGAAIYCSHSCDCERTWNAGVMVVRPNAESFKNIVDGFDTIIWGGQGDQGYLNAYFRTHGGHVPISQFYNIGKNVARCAFDEWFFPEKFRVFHFAGNDHKTHPNAIDPKTLEHIEDTLIQRDVLEAFPPKQREKMMLMYYQKYWWKRLNRIYESYSYQG